MANPQHAAAETSPTAAPGPETGAIPLAPLPHSGAAATTAMRPGQNAMDRFLIFLVLVLAFLTASFVARNSDFWFHLATGRLLAQGDFVFGDDPFAYTTKDVYWANHAWLFDLALYTLHDLVGGARLVVIKALLVAGLAYLLLRVRHPGGSAWVPAVCTTLAVLAMSPRLLLQPVCVSYFLLGLTFWLLWSCAERGGTSAECETRNAMRQAGARAPRPAVCTLLVVFVLWVNIDEWFLLGPVLASLFWIGERLQGQKSVPGWVVPAGLAACLLNPHTFHVFSLPNELSPVSWSSGLREDARFQALFTAVWQPAYLDAVFARLNPAALAYFALFLLGLLSFLLQRQALGGWRLVVWLPFALLAAWHARAIPFFAIVAAPITALNLQDFLALRAKCAGTSRQRRAAGLTRGATRFAIYASLLALIFLTWPGWLTRDGRESRRVGWDVQIDLSLQRVAETLHLWRREGLLTAGERVLALSPEVAHYGAWFCPGEKHFFDQRFHLFRDAAGDYVTVCRELLPGLGPPGSEANGDKSARAKDWDQVLREQHVGVVIFYDREPQRLFWVLRRLAGDRQRWTLLHVAGQALVAGWNEARPVGAFAALAFDPDRLAFGPQDERAQRELPAAPEKGLERLPPPRDFWAHLARAPAPLSWESAAASVYWHYFDDYEPWHGQHRLQLSLSAFAVGLAGLPALPGAVSQPAFHPALPHLACPLLLSRNLVLSSRGAPDRFLVRDQLGPFFASLVERPPALPLLAVRAARRAVAANPEDASAWLRLGQAYLQLRNLTCERSSEGMLPPLAHLRHVQIATALEQAVRLDPDLATAHHELAYLYGERNYVDQSLEHRRQELGLSRRAGPRPGETAEDFADRMELEQKDIAKLEELVNDRRQRYASGSRQLQGRRLALAGLALQLGLARQAVEEILMPTPADLLGAPGMTLELNLLLQLGRADEVRTILSEDTFRAHKHKLGSYNLPAPRNPGGSSVYLLPYIWPAYDWLHALEASALGNYADAREAMRAIRTGLHAGHERLLRQQEDLASRVRSLLAGLLTSPPAFAAQALGRLAEERAMLQAGEPILRAHQADLYVLEGMLAVEQGSVDAAKSAFIQAEKLCAEPPGATVRFAGGPIAASYLRHLNFKGR